MIFRMMKLIMVTVGELRPVEECAPSCMKASHSRSCPAMSTTLEAVHKGVPGEIKMSQIEQEPHYAERCDFRVPRADPGLFLVVRGAWRAARVRDYF